MKNIIYAILLIGVFVTANIFITTEVAKNKSSGFSKLQVKNIEKIVHDYLLNNPKILIEVSNKLQEQEETTRKEQHKKTKKDLPKYKKQLFDAGAPGRLVFGNPNGKIIITEFTQHQCPHCKETADMVSKLLKSEPEIKLIIAYWPFFGNDATYTSKAVLAAQKQNKGELLNQAFFDNQAGLNKEKADKIIQGIPGLDSKKLYKDMKDDKLTGGLKDNFELAQKAGLGGTPAFIFTNEEMTKFDLIPGRTPTFKTDLVKAINKVR